MAICTVHWSSSLIMKQVGMHVILPDKGKGPFAVYYLLHGLSDDYTIWQRRTRIEMYVANLPLIVVMPDGFRAFYTNHNIGHPFARYIGEELPDFVERNFPAKKNRAGRCIGGLSMGGYGALRLALGYPDRYISANSHSGALMAAQNAHSRHRDIVELDAVFGRNPVGTDHDLVHLAKKAKRAGKLPRIRIDCGTEDFLIEDNRKYHKTLSGLKIPHEYEEFPGMHNWDYWDIHVREALAFHARALGIKP